MIGLKVSHYKILEHLGGGGMGVVYKAEDTRLKRTVALKFLPPELTRDPEAKQRFIHEAQAASALQHNNICVVHDIDETDDGQMFIVMENYEGETLNKKIERGALKIEEAVGIATQIAQGLAKAHEHGIVHRDIKPANVVVTTDGVAKIVDFGLAKLSGQTMLTKTGSTVGTAAYMSPEQAQGNPVDHRTDIWSLGVVLYEMLAGQRPFRNEYEQALIYCLLNEDPEPVRSLRDEVPIGLEEIVARAMAKDPAERYGRAEDMVIDLKMLEEEEGPRVREQPPFVEALRGPSGSQPFPLPGPEGTAADAARPVFVAREHELAKLDRILDRALSGHGQVAFITGEAGDGKTALINEFARRAQEMHPNLAFARGNCNAHTGIGDPYLPFREILSLLTGDVQDKWAVGVMTSEHAARLWNLLPRSVQALMDAGPDLVDTFLSGSALLSRAATFSSGRAAWLPRLKKFVDRKGALPADSKLQQSSLFEQYCRVVQRLAGENPLLLVLDDLQWADAGSVSLLFHLGRRIEGNSILILGAYRPAEIAQRRDGDRHPLEPVINEFRRTFGDLEVPLGQVEDRHFIDALLGVEPNLLDTTFRNTLFQQTKGNPLFTIELLRGMQEQGALIKDTESRWVEGQKLNWNALPARVDAVIEERISRLPGELRDVLTLASIEGEEFTADVVATLHKIDVGTAIHHLSSELDRRQHLVSAVGSRRAGTHRLSLYKFQHILFQRHMYNSLDEVERMHLHEQVGNLLESLYGEQTEEIALHLARHYQEAGITEKAIDYMLLAGRKAVKLSANQEAIAHFSKALELLETLPETSERVQKELTLQLAVIVPLQAAQGFASPHLWKAAARARELCQRIQDPPQLFTALAQLVNVYATRPEYRTALAFEEQLNEIAVKIPDPMLTAVVKYVRLWPLLNVGELVQAREAAEGITAFYDPERHGNLAYIYGYDYGVLGYGFGSWVQWMLGCPDRALKWLNESISIARKLNHPFTLAFSLFCGCELYWFLRDLQKVNRYTDEMMPLSIEKGFVYWQAHGIFYRGERQTLEGEVTQGIAQMRQGLAMMRGTGTETCLTRLLARMADACMKMGQLDEGLAAIAEATGFMERFDERYVEAELYRLKGELLLLRSEDEADAERCFLRAIDVSRRQQAKSWELRAVMSLSRLRCKQVKRDEALRQLTETYEWFTEGFETPDLKEAKTLLEKMNR